MVDLLRAAVLGALILEVGPPGLKGADTGLGLVGDAAILGVAAAVLFELVDRLAGRLR